MLKMKLRCTMTKHQMHKIGIAKAWVVGKLCACMMTSTKVSTRNSRLNEDVQQSCNNSYMLYLSTSNSRKITTQVKFILRKCTWSTSKTCTWSKHNSNFLLLLNNGRLSQLLGMKRNIHNISWRVLQTYIMCLLMFCYVHKNKYI